MKQEQLTKKEMMLKHPEQYYLWLTTKDNESLTTDTSPAEDEKARATDVLDPYLHKIFEVSDKYLKRVFNEEILNEFRRDCFRHIRGDRNSTIEQYVKAYYDLVKREYQKQYSNADPSLNQSIFSEPDTPKALWGNCLGFLRRMDSESVQLMVTSPPYYNARIIRSGKLWMIIWRICPALSRNAIGFWTIIVLSFLMLATYLTTTIGIRNHLGENVEYLWGHISL